MLPILSGKPVTRNPFAMAFSVHPFSQEAALIRIGKRLDMEHAPAFKKAYRPLVVSGVYRLILDFSETGILDSSGLGALLSLYRLLGSRTDTEDFAVVIAAASPPVQSVVNLTHIYKIFPQYPSVEDAREALAC